MAVPATLLTGCAGQVGVGAPGGVTTSATSRTSASAGQQVAGCVHEVPRPAVATFGPESPHPSVSLRVTAQGQTNAQAQALAERERGEQFQRNYEANKAFRKRRPLPDAVLAANQQCAQQVRESLELLRAGQEYDAAAITKVLSGIGLTTVTVRPAGRLDLAGYGGLLFAGWTGQACIFGEHGAKATTVNVGSMIADGGCLPAPD
jgi:hypothetical protein